MSEYIYRIHYHRPIIPTATTTNSTDVQEKIRELLRQLGAKSSDFAMIVLAFPSLAGVEMPSKAMLNVHGLRQYIRDCRK